jgi:hypothetical protein
MCVVIASDGASLRERSRNADTASPGSWGWPAALSADGNPPAAGSISGLEEELEAIGSAELENDFGIAPAWEMPRAVVTEGGPGLLIIGLDENGVRARLWRIVS